MNMNRIATLFRLRNSVGVGSPSHLWVPLCREFCDCVEPKKKKYRIVPELEEAMELRKKPLLIIELKDIIQSRGSKTLLLQDLEKEIGFARKWNFMNLIQKNPKIFRVGGGGPEKSPPFVALTKRAEKIAEEESEALKAMEPILVKNLRKLLMLTVNCRLDLDMLKQIAPDLGLPSDFETSLIPRYPEFFAIKCVPKGKPCLCLENWDSSLAVTAREEKLAAQGIHSRSKNPKVRKMPEDGSYLGPHAFRIVFSAGFRPNRHYLNFHIRRWQMLDFPSPYLNARRFENDWRAKKRRIGVIHEILNLTMEKKLTTEMLRLLAPECFLPRRLIIVMINFHMIFYIANKCTKQPTTVILKEAYDGSNLIEKCPILAFRDRFVGLSLGRGREDRTSSPKRFL